MVTICDSQIRTASKPLPQYALVPATIGDHIRKKRRELGITGGETARRIGTSDQTLWNWAEGRTNIEVRFYPAVIRFIGYNPLPEPATRGEAVRRERFSRGLSCQKLADLAGVDEATVRRIEADTRRMAQRATAAVCCLLGLEVWMTSKNKSR